MRTTFLTLLLAVVVPLEALGKVTYITLQELVQDSTFIVVAKVETTHKPLFGKRTAKALVLEVWKGKPTERVEFLASPTWTCDISEATKGETVLLFLTQDGKTRTHRIAHSGRGRMPLHTEGGRSYVAFWTEVRLPKDTPTIAGPDPRMDFVRSVDLETIRDLVKRTLATTDNGE
ncbi:MAG: hypothetical protein J0L84_14835 [Verrucomicrobia bacterium]|nr:hypothetical protein [Verrucomicrobiota bacterium]